MAAAEVIDALRVFPRTLVVAYGYLVGYLSIIVTTWYLKLPPAERTVEVTAFFAMLLGGLFGLAAYVFTTYTNGGYDWQKYREFNADHTHQRLPVSSSPNPPG